jgi:hypothetical protein
LLYGKRITGKPVNASKINLQPIPASQLDSPYLIYLFSFAAIFEMDAAFSRA